EAGWSDLLQLSYKWRVTPQVWQRLQALEIALDPTIKQEFAQLCRMVAVQSSTASYRSAHVLHRLNQAGVNAIAFKGIGLIAGLYGKPGDRMVGDVDILIPPADLSATCTALTELGFSADIDGNLTEYLDYLATRTREDNYFLVLKDAKGFEIDLHWQLKAIAGVQLNVQDLIDRAVTVSLHSQPVRVANPVDAILLTAHHSLRDDFAPKTALKDLCDLSAWWAVRDRWALDNLITQAQATGLTQALLCLWQVLADLNPDSPVSAGIAQFAATLSAADQETARSLSELFHWQLQGNSVNRDLLHSLNFETIKRFIVRRLQKGATLSFDQSLWGIRHNRQLSWAKFQRLWHDLTTLDRRKLNAYKALSHIQNRK
ncbi:MAG TPA: nucleotidyltransferase family protein, partial [Chroococcidiopsis sp.]